MKEEDKKHFLEEERQLLKLGILDQIIAKLMSRKLLVFLIATLLLIFRGLPFEEWAAIAFAYIGILGIADIAAVWRNSKK